MNRELGVINMQFSWAGAVRGRREQYTTDYGHRRWRGSRKISRFSAGPLLKKEMLARKRGKP